MQVITRAEWGGRNPKATPQTVSITNRTATCTHHAGGSDVNIKTFAEACAYVRQDQNYHMDHNGWDDIGYNFLVVSALDTPVDGMVFAGRGRDAVGAHAYGYNVPWIGIQVTLGGNQTPSPEALNSLRTLYDEFSIDANKVLGKKVHSDGNATACPGKKLKAWVHAGMHYIDGATVVRPPVKPSRGGSRTSSAPAFRLPAGHYYGTTRPSFYCHSGLLSAKDRVQIKLYQQQMSNRGWPISVDGLFGPQTESITRQFQIEKHLTVDNKVGPNTWKSAWTATVT